MLLRVSDINRFAIYHTFPLFVCTLLSYLSKRVREGQKANGKRIESIGCFVFEKNPKNTQSNQYFGNRFFLVVLGIFLKNETPDLINSFSIGFLPFSQAF